MTNLNNCILGIITTNEKKVGGSSPIFYCENREELNQVASDLEYIMDALAHQISEEIVIIVKH